MLARCSVAAGDYLAAFVETVAASNPVLVGHSMGTQVVAEAVVQHPGLSDRTVLIAPVVNPAEQTAWQQALRLVQDLADENIRVLALGLYYYLKAGPSWFLKKLRQMLRHDLDPILPRIAADTLVVRGVRDRVSPHDWAAHVASRIPRAALVEVPGCGHEAMLRDPEPIAEIILKHACGGDAGAS